jgi:acetyl-CoA acetyltransferase
LTTEIPDPGYQPSSAIVGVAEAPLGAVSGQHQLRMMAGAVIDALDEAGLTLRDVDALMIAGFPSGQPSCELADYLGIAPRFVSSTEIGGSSFEFFAGQADLAISAGLCDTVVIAYANLPRQNRGKPIGFNEMPFLFRHNLEMPTGLIPLIGSYALAASRHMHEFGTTSEQLAEIAVAARRWAQLNPKAFRREPLTIEDVLNSPMVSAPLHARDCCLVTDGGGAVVLTSRERARDLRQTPVSVLGFGQKVAYQEISLATDVVRTGAIDSGAQAFAMAGLSRSDVDVTQIYDSFTITVLLGLEDLGFCGKGEGGDFVSGGRIAPDGSFPLNTSGGGLSYTHPGHFGIFLLIEAVRQLRGECGDRQVPDAQVAVAHGFGGVLSTAATVILGKDLR